MRRLPFFLTLMLLFVGCSRAALPTVVVPVATPVSVGLRYLLPPDFDITFVVPVDERTFADEQSFQVALIPAGATPGPETTIIVGGGTIAEPVWKENQPGGLGAWIEPIQVRGVEGTLASSGFGMTIAWVEAGQAYYVITPGSDIELAQTFVNTLAHYSLKDWRDVVGVD